MDSRGICDCPARASGNTSGVSAGSRLRGSTVVFTAASRRDPNRRFMKPSFELFVNPSDGRSPYDGGFTVDPEPLRNCGAPTCTFTGAFLRNDIHGAIVFVRYPCGKFLVRSLHSDFFRNAKISIPPEVIWRRARILKTPIPTSRCQVRLVCAAPISDNRATNERCNHMK